MPDQTVSKSINPYGGKVNDEFRKIVVHYKLPTYKLIRHIQKKYNVSLQEVGDVIGISKQAVQVQYLNYIKKAQEELSE